MKIDTFECLEKIRNKFGPGIFGKIVQKLLALTFCDAGFLYMVERGVQGVDIDVTSPDGMRYAVEVKTTDADRITISQDNIEALKDRTHDGYIPLIAALRMQPFEDWILASIPIARLQRGTHLLSRLRAYRVKDIESLICPAFEAATKKHSLGVLNRGEDYLREILAQKRDVL